MKRILNLLLLLLLSNYIYAQDDLPLQRFNAPLITGGIITRFSPHLIPDNSVQDALNILFDEDIGIVRRRGYSKYNSSAIGSSTDVRGLWDFTANDGTRYIMAVSNGSLYESSGDGSFSTVSGITGLTADAFYDGVSYLGEFWLTNGIDNVKSWDGSSATDVSTAPKGTMIEGWRNRIVISGVTGNQSRVYLSEELDGTNFTTGPTLSTSPVILSIGGIDAKPVKCLYADYKDTLIVFTEDETYAVYGFGFDDFVVRRVTNEVGCIDDKTVREKDGNLYWLSRRGLEKWSGTEINRISDTIRDLFDDIISNISDNRFILVTSQSDWEAGNLIAQGAGYPISATQIPGSIEPDRVTFTIDTKTEWDLGTVGNLLSTNITTDAIQPAIVYSNAGFEDGSVSPYSKTSNFDILNSSSRCVGDYCARSQEVNFSCSTSKFQILNEAGDSTLYETTLQCGSGLLGTPVDVSGLAGTKIRMRAIDTSTGNYILSPAFFRPNGYVNISCGSCGAPFNEVVVDFNEPFYLTGGTYISEALNTGYTTPVGGTFDVEYTNSGDVADDPDFSVRKSTDGASWGAWASISDEDAITLDEQYWQYKIEFSDYFDTISIPSIVSSVQLPATTNGQYITECFDIGSGINEWGLFQANNILQDSGSIVYAVTSGASCAAVENPAASWTTQVNNTKIGVTTNPYLGVRATFSMTDYDSQASIQDITVNWNEGGIAKPLASIVYDDRYFLAFDSNTDGINDKVAVLDKRDTWTLFDNITCASMSLYNRKWHCGTSETDGFVYLMDTGFNDDGSDFTASFRTKAYWLGDQDAEKEFNKLYISLLTDNTEPIPQIDVTYRLDDSSTALSLGSLLVNEDSTSGILQAKVPFPQSQNLTGRYIDFEFSNTGQRPFTIFNFNIYYKLYPIK
jgi:hypothetical protein